MPQRGMRRQKKNFLSVGNKKPSSERHNVRISFGHCIQVYWQWNIHGGSMNSGWIQASCYMLCSIMTWVHSNMSPCRCEVAIPALHIWLVSELGEWEKSSAAVFMKVVLWHWVERKVSTPPYSWRLCFGTESRGKSLQSLLLSVLDNSRFQVQVTWTLIPVMSWGCLPGDSPTNLMFLLVLF